MAPEEFGHDHLHITFDRELITLFARFVVAVEAIAAGSTGPDPTDQTAIDAAALEVANDAARLKAAVAADTPNT